MIAAFKKVQKGEDSKSTQAKQKNLTNQKTDRTREVEIDGMRIRILFPEVKLSYLGQIITFVDQETTAAQHRIPCAWSAFARHRQLTSQSHLLRHQIHPFDTVVTPTIMFGAGTRTTTKEHGKMLRTTQRRMLRVIKRLGSRHFGSSDTWLKVLKLKLRLRA